MIKKDVIETPTRKPAPKSFQNVLLAESLRHTSLMSRFES